MSTPKMLIIPSSVVECIYLMQTYVYIDKYTGEVHVREIAPFVAPGFILGVCAQIPFLQSFVSPYINDAIGGNVYEVTVSDQWKGEVALNEYVNSHLIYYQYTPNDCDFVLSVMLNAIIQSMFGHTNIDFKNYIDESVADIADTANIYPMSFFLPNTFRHTIKTTLNCVPHMRTRMMSLLCQKNIYPKGNVWSLIKRYIWIQVRNYHMGTFVAIGQWYEAREKTLAHVDPEIVEEMKRYEKVSEEIKAIAHEQGYTVGTFRILNPQSMLPYLRQFPCSAYCAIEYKKKMVGRSNQYHIDFNRFGIDQKSLDRMMSIPVKYTLKRRLNDEEIKKISSKRFKALETEYTENDHSDYEDSEIIPNEE